MGISVVTEAGLRACLPIAGRSLFGTARAITRYLARDKGIGFANPFRGIKPPVFAWAARKHWNIKKNK